MFELKDQKMFEFFCGLLRGEAEGGKNLTVKIS